MREPSGPRGKGNGSGEQSEGESHFEGVVTLGWEELFVLVDLTYPVVLGIYTFLYGQTFQAGTMKPGASILQRERQSIESQRLGRSSSN